MPKRITNEAFLSQIRTLGPGDVAHHSMLFPGVYPSDRQLHEAAKCGAKFKPDGPFYDAAQQALVSGARLEWLRVLPAAGEFGYDETDITAMKRVLGGIARFGFDVRIVTYSDHAPRIIGHCENESPVVSDFLDGLERGDPRKSSWATFRRRQTGKLAIAYLDTMDYDNGKFEGHIQHAPPGPVDTDIAKWTYCWRETYDRYGKPLNPPSS